MDIRDLRDKIFSFFFPVFLVVSILGCIVWVVGKTYYWDVSSLRVQLDAPSHVIVRLQAELFKKDIHILGFDYPIHFTLPWSREQECSEICDITRLPPGDGSILVSNGVKSQTFFVSIARNTAGTADFRTPIRIRFLDDNETKKSYARSLTIEEKNALNSIVFTNNIAWISVSTQAGKDVFYDVLTRQILTPSVPLDMVFLGPNKGEYYLVNNRDIILWDRYGRKATQKITDIYDHEIQIHWGTGNTTFKYKNEEQSLAWIWFPVDILKGQRAFSDGKRIIVIDLLQEEK